MRSLSRSTSTFFSRSMKDVRFINRSHLSQALPFRVLRRSMSTAEERSTKRARIEIKPYTELDLSEFTLKNKGKGTNGGHMAYPLLAGESIRFNLTANEWLRTHFGFDVDSKFDKPSFLGGKVPPGGIFCVTRPCPARSSEEGLEACPQ